MKQSDHELILKEVAKCVSNSDWAIYEENSIHHVSGVCFLSDYIKEIVMRVVKEHVNESSTECVVGYSEGIDQTAITIASEIGYVLGKPIFSYVMGNDDSLDPHIDGKTCSVIVAYTSFAQQIVDMIETIENKGGRIKQIIALVDEKGEVEDIVPKREIEFHRFLQLKEICDTLQRLEVPKREKLDSKIELLCR